MTNTCNSLGPYAYHTMEQRAHNLPLPNHNHVLTFPSQSREKRILSCKTFQSLMRNLKKKIQIRNSLFLMYKKNV